MKKLKKCLALLTAMALTLALVGCGDKPADEEEPAEDAQVEEPAEEQQADPEGTHVVTDNTGAEIEVPNTINRIIILSTMPLASVFCMVEGSGEKLVGLNPTSKNAAEHSFLNRVAPELANVSTDFASGDTVNIEEVMNLKPDVVFYNSDGADDVAATEQLKELGVPCVGFTTNLEGFSTIETFNLWATLIGDVMQHVERADEIVKYGRDVEAKVKERVKDLAPEDRKTALILVNYNDSTILASCNIFGRYWLETVGATNVANEIDARVSPISLEQIYTWDPDVILFNSFTPYTPEQIMSNTAVEGQDWSGLKAVKNGEVYKFPLGVYYWYPPCSDSPLALQWLAKTVYPELFEDIDLDAEIIKYYKEFYGLDLTEEDLDTLYNPPAESAVKKI